MKANNTKKANKSLSIAIIWQLAGNILLQGIGLLTTPIFTRLLTPSDYGQTATFSSWCAIVGTVVGLQLSGTIGIVKNKISKERYEAFCSSTLALSFCSFLLLQFVFCVLRKPLGEMMKFPEWLVPFIVLYSFSQYVISFFSTKLEYDFRVELKTGISALVSVSTVALSLAATVAMTENRYIGKIIGTIIPTIIISIIEMFVIFKTGKCLYEKEHWIYGLKLSLPLIFHVGAGVILAQSDTVMLKSIVNETETGIYSVVYTLAAVVNIIWVSFNHAWLPFYYKYKADQDYTQIQQKSNGYLFNFTIITIGFMLCAPEVFKILAPENYWGGLKIIPLVAGAYYINFLYSFPANHEFFCENTRIISVAMVTSALINVVINLLLIPKYHSIGAAVATLISYGIAFLIHDICARYVVKNYEYGIMFYLKGLVPVSVMVILYYFLSDFAIIRWLLAVALGIVLVLRMVKKRSIF